MDIQYEERVTAEIENFLREQLVSSIILHCLSEELLVKLFYFMGVLDIRVNIGI
jgi:hypothetical protein